MSNNLYTKEHKAIIEKLKKARQEAGLDQIAVAKKLGKTQSYVSKIESGQRKVEALQLKKFAKIYNKNITYFI
ncbi:helix-turn-helix transcriptional regulator [Patescibacteria group bacterium]|nr:helix-turn-helix transcriptional regulator [Candidatus Falkowbacteria bacterium]MBU3906409.1 helix-turn-helix transcriptional regulator [Patescibacteria group bacterium]MCG2698182.1 helix-turn-helix transcriptional regulator [Candidatus Parcubacteria bacterium]MBU4014884.1 helix-turn-helix transcriptional regulator [Patescibacteria group bacterium]MBU4026839.1 helix-turn-helix transcriptional regulator [Patescibacteria group bacterium]